MAEAKTEVKLRSHLGGLWFALHFLVFNGSHLPFMVILIALFWFCLQSVSEIQLHTVQTRGSVSAEEPDCKSLKVFRS